LIIEIIGVPGSGKTTLANLLMKEYQGSFFCIKGKSSVPNMENCENWSDYIHWFNLKLIILFSFFLTPVTIVIFFKYFFLLFFLGCSTRLAKSSNIAFGVYILFLLNYQLVRYFLANVVSLVTAKHVIIDEGFFYNAIRLRQFISPAISSELNNEYINSLYFFRTHIIKLDIDPDTALCRFKLREKNSSASLYKRWYVDQFNTEWMDLVWSDIDVWIKELVIRLVPDVVTVSEIEEVSINLNKIMDYIDEHK